MDTQNSDQDSWVNAVCVCVEKRALDLTNLEGNIVFLKGQLREGAELNRSQSLQPRPNFCASNHAGWVCN